MDRKNFKFIPGLANDGKPVIDFRTIPLRAVLKLKNLPPLPYEADAHEAVGGLVDDRMFGNDKYGDCVIAAQAHYTLTFEKFEQGSVIPISDSDVINEYLRQSGGRDTGLVLTYAMKEWKNTGWMAGGKSYGIYAFAGVDALDHTQIKYSIHLLRGVIVGMMVFSADIDQFRNSEPWHLTGSNGTFEGGHGVYGFKYQDNEGVTFSTNPIIRKGSGYAVFPTITRVLNWDEKGMTVMTWGEEQFGTWDFWDARINQAFCVVDNKNKWQGANSPLDVEAMDAYLHEISGEVEAQNGCAICKMIKKVLH